MSRAAPLLELALQVAHRHERAPADRITLVPVVVDDLEAALPVLRALAYLSEGRLLNTLETELTGPVPGTADPVRRAAITEALTRAATLTRHIDIVDQGNGLIDAVFGDRLQGAESQGEQSVLAVARALAHADLDIHRFAVVCYRENAIDLEFRQAIWALAVNHLNGMPHPTLRTLLLVAENVIDIGVHCQPEGQGFQLAVQGHRLLCRNSPGDLRVQAGSIARHKEPFVLFLGAGFAASSHLPLGDAMRDSAIRRLLGVPHDDVVTPDQLAANYHDWVAGHNWLSPIEQEMPQAQFIRQLTVEQVIRNEQRIDPTLPSLREFKLHHDGVVNAPGAAVLDLATVLELARARIVLAEVNFDLLIETHSRAVLRIFASNDQFREAPEYVRRYLAGKENAIPLLKLHGTISDLETCVVSSGQTELGISAEKLETLRALLDNDHPRLWVYVGASMRDLDLRQVLIGAEFARGVDERWVAPYLVDSVEEFAKERQAMWRRSELQTIQDRLISETADAFMAALRIAFPVGA